MKCAIIVLGFIALSILNPVRTYHETPKTHITIKDTALYRAVVAPAPETFADKPTSTTATSVSVSAPAVSVTAPVSGGASSQPVQEPSGCAVYLSLVEQYNWPVTTMMAIMQAESGCNPDAYNPSGCYGLFQLYGEEITDPAQNIAAAYQIYLRQGLSAWSSYNSGVYLDYELL